MPGGGDSWRAENQFSLTLKRKQQNQQLSVSNQAVRASMIQLQNEIASSQGTS
jgi:hypothetical protein